jgi:AraC family transcriptional regulator
MKSSASRAAYSSRIDAAIDHIQRCPQADLSLAGLARVAHFSPYHFHRLFRSFTGETVKGFVMRARLDRALVLMRAAPRKPLGQVGHECGFASASAFSRAFRQAFAVAPSAADVAALLAERRQQAGSADRHAALFGDHRRAAGVDHPAPRIEPCGPIPLARVRVVGGYLDPARLVDGYHRLEAWVDAAGIDRQAAALAGMAIDDPEVVPLAKCRHDFARFTEQRPARGSGLAHSRLAACRWAVLPVEGDLQAVGAAWEWLFRSWLPSSGWQPAALPAIEVFHRRPEEIGWDRFDLDCRLPVEPLVL